MGGGGEQNCALTPGLRFELRCPEGEGQVNGLWSIRHSILSHASFLPHPFLGTTKRLILASTKVLRYFTEEKVVAWGPSGAGERDPILTRSLVQDDVPGPRGWGMSRFACISSFMKEKSGRLR